VFVRRLFLLLLLAAACVSSGCGTRSRDTFSDEAMETQAEANSTPEPAALRLGSAVSADVVTVVCEPKFYVAGVSSNEDLDLFKKADAKRMWEVTGIVLEVVRPPEYAGKIITMHHDGVLASGDPYWLWEVGKRYEFKIDRTAIGRFDFVPCSLGGTRKLVTD
jgi:hypothetical protein